MAWAPDYVTTEEMRDYLRISDDDDNALIALAISAASRAVDKYAGRQFGVVAAAEERLYSAVWDRRRCRWVVEIDDLMSTTNLAVTCTAGTITGYTLEPVNAAKISRPWTRLVVDSDSSVQPTSLVNDMAVTALWGWSSVPESVEQATRLQAHRFHTRRKSPYGVAGSPDEGTALRLLARVDPDVGVALNPYRRVWGAA
jgi:hypothetical protein